MSVARSPSHTNRPPSSRTCPLAGHALVSPPLSKKLPLRAPGAARGACHQAGGFLQLSARADGAPCGAHLRLRAPSAVASGRLEPGTRHATLAAGGGGGGSAAARQRRTAPRAVHLMTPAGAHAPPPPPPPPPPRYTPDQPSAGADGGQAPPAAGPGRSEYPGTAETAGYGGGPAQDTVQPGWCH